MNVYVKEGKRGRWSHGVMEMGRGRWSHGDEDGEGERERFGEWRVYLGYNVCLYVYIG